MKYIQRAYILSNSPKISTTRKNNNFLLLWNGNAQNVPKVLYLVFWPIFGPPTQKMTPYTTMEVHLEAHIFLKAYINSYYQKIYLFLTFVPWKCIKCIQKSYIRSFWPIFGPPNPQNGPLYYQGSTFRGPYFAKSLHKLVLPENILISYFCGMEMHKMYPKVVYLVILTYFRTP